jgi:hypothetical protein
MSEPLIKKFKQDKKFNKKFEQSGIDEKLGIEVDENEIEERLKESVQDIIESPEIESNGPDMDMLKDYQTAREALLVGMAKGHRILDQALAAIVLEGGARTVEVATMALKTLSESANAVLDLHSKIQKLQDSKKSKDEKTINGDNVRKGTLQELLQSARH